MALPRQLKEISFDVGLNTKGDRRAQPEQLLDIAVNVEFDDIYLRCRFPFDNVRTALVGGGALANARKLAMLGDELVCFTATALYSWIPALSAWEYRSDHLAVATDEQTVFATSSDQDFADRAELNGHVVHCWIDGAGLWIAVRDKATDAAVQLPTIIPIAGAGHSNIAPRLVVLNSCVLLFWIDFAPVGTTSLKVAKITIAPYTFTAAVAPLTILSGVASGFNFDACRIPGQDRCYVSVPYPLSGGYSIISVDSTFAGAQTTGTLIYPGSGNVSTAIAVSPDAAFCTVVVAGASPGSAVIVADVWNVTAAGVPLTPVAAATQIGLDVGLVISAPRPSQCTAAYRLTQDGGHYRCYAFWSFGEADNSPFYSVSNWIDATGATGVAAPFVFGLGIAARAFARDSHVYLVGVFAGLSVSFTDPTGTHSELQNTYYLYRDDKLLIGKAVWGEAGGFHGPRWLPGVAADAANANAMVFMGAIRRVVPVAANSNFPFFNYAERALREVTFTFDDNRARRCVQFGETLYVLGSIVLQYDGVQLVEVGTCSYPWLLNVVAGAAGAPAAAGYSFKATDRWMNARGEVDRSTTATVSNYTNAGATKMSATMPNLYITRKTGVALEMWRTAGNPAKGDPFFLATSPDPSVLGGDNGYITNDPTSNAPATVSDNLADAQLTVLTANPENGADLPNIEPPPATICFADSQRIYLAGIAGNPNTVYYSKYRQTGLVAAFSDTLSFDVPTDGGPITALGLLDGSLIVWCETATYQFAGVGFDDTGGGTNFQLARTLSKDTGCEAQEACALFGDGFLVSASKGWYLLDRSLNYTYVGFGVAKYDAEAILAITVLSARQQVRILTSGRILVFDTLVKQWSETSVNDGLDLLQWMDAPAYLTATGVRAELATWDGYAGTDYTLTSIDIEGSWIKFGDNMQSRAIVDFVQLLGEFRSTCAIRTRLASDYQASSPGVWNYHTDEPWPPSPAIVGSSLQHKQGLRFRRCEALKTRFTITAPDGVSPLGGPCVRMTSIAMPYAIEPNAYSGLAAAQKT